MQVIKTLFQHTKLTYYELSNIVKDIINRDDIATLDWIISTNKIASAPSYGILKNGKNPTYRQYHNNSHRV